ncbi:MAG: cellulase family glycosylhydrolase [Verrucomicrobia bacterium]|nr:cellulase family glycosylhydrolase [Verrucomicrobiota bacterium]MBI3870059.1 cellulase family glycosylhydrolase [Verrucomicrobiota bacterium]
MSCASQWVTAAGVAIASLLSCGAAGPITVQGTAVAGARLEFSILNVPAVLNRFDPDQIRVDATLTAPSGKSISSPAFWHQAYTRSLNGSTESLATQGAPSWRARFWPGESGRHQLTLRVLTNGVDAGSPYQTNVDVGPASGPLRWGADRLGPTNEYFQTADGAPLPLVGANICWYHEGGTYDYDTWFTKLAANGGNFARIWMAPWAFGIESEPANLTRFRLDHAWQLDRVLMVAEQKGIHLMLCLEYHGMFATKPDGAFGGNDNWKLNPYNTANGGPCATPDAFFTDNDARKLYQKRLRYLIARYGYSPNLLAWEFLNEIDNVYDAQNGALNASHVAAWHDAMGTWLKANDPFKHLITTSLTGSSDRAEIWKIPAIDFSQFHSYGTLNPATALASIATRMRKAYGKPMLVGEFGVDFRGWMRTQEDPFLRGFRQAIWGGALGGSAGTSMSWWWENLQSENVYVLHQALRSVLSRAHWGEGAWEPITFEGAPPRPTTVGSVIPGAPSFTANLIPSQNWGAMPIGQLAIVDPESAASAASSLNGFVHGTGHPELKTPFKLSAWLDAGARITAHVNSVSIGARLAFYVDGVSVLSTNLPDKDGKFDAFANEYNVDISAPLSAGKHLLEIRNTGGDWFFLDWVKVQAVRPSLYPAAWEPALVSVGLRGASESLLYVASPRIDWPANSTNPAPALVTNRFVVATNWPAGLYGIRWFLTTNAMPIAETEATTEKGRLRIPVPTFDEDLAAIVVRKPSLKPPLPSPGGALQSSIDADPGSIWELESSVDMLVWKGVKAVVNSPAPAPLDLGPPLGSKKYFRLSQVPP